MIGKKILLTSIILLSVFLVYGQADALSGSCGGCHTMHNSQDGVDGSGPNELLLKSTCAGCHTTGSAIGPQIDKTSEILAGGSFDTTTIATTAAKRHDVQDLSLTEGIAATPGNGGDSIITLSPNDLTCAGAKGCHGKHVTGMGSDAGISGSHHGAADATYRFLWIGTSVSPTAVFGIGDADREATVSNTDHNVYSADSTQGISSFCNQCHGEFHGTDATETGGTASPWKRHPTDYKLFTIAGADWDDSQTNLNADDAPIGLVSIGTNVTTTNYYQDGVIDTDNSAVICLSCHRAHGSSNDDLLRWDYSTMNAGEGGTTGCLSCHYAQR